MITKKLLAVAALFAMSTAANATLFNLSQPVIQQTVPTMNVATGLGVTTGSGTWTWDDVSNTVTQTGANTFTFGPALPGSVGYVLNVTGMVITSAGVTTATSYTCTDGNFATSFIFASICGGYNYTNFVSDSVLSPDACTLTVGGDDVVTAPTLCIAYAFNNFTATFPVIGLVSRNYSLSVRDTLTPGILKVRDAGFIIFGPTSSYGQANAGWEFQFTILPVVDTDGDGVADNLDNCRLVANPTQLDANADGYGNICDADINNSGTVTSADFGLLRSVLGQAAGASATAGASDMNGSGTVTSADFGLLRARLGTLPGPSGLACAGTIPCPP